MPCWIDHTVSKGASAEQSPPAGNSRVVAIFHNQEYPVCQSFDRKCSVDGDPVWTGFDWGQCPRYTSSKLQLQIEDFPEWPLAFALRTCARSITPPRR